MTRVRKKYPISSSGDERFRACSIISESIVQGPRPS